MRIELHQVIGRAHLSVPASELLAAARPLGAPGCDQLDVLSSEGQLLHAALHCTQHHFYFGLKTSWDLLWICERDPALDWDRLQRWVGLCASPLAFAVPVAVLQRDLQLLLPPPLLKMVQAATATASGSGSALALRRRGVVVRIAQRNWCAAPESYPGDGLARYAIRLVPPLRPVARLLATGWLVGRCGHHLAAGATRGRLFTGGCEQNTTAATLAQRSLWSVSKVAVGRLYRLWVPQANAPQAVAATAPDE